MILPLNQRLVLFDFLLHEFGFKKFDDLRNKFREMELDASIPGNSLFYQNLASSVRFTAGKFKLYDENLISHLAVINTSRSEPIRLKYYQYFSLLFTEYYLDHYFAAHELREGFSELLRFLKRVEGKGSFKTRNQLWRKLRPKSNYQIVI